MRFVKINGIIYDYSQYKLNVLNIKKAVFEEIEDVIVRFGFVKQKENIFLNKKFDLLMNFSVKKRSRLKFV